MNTTALRVSATRSRIRSKICAWTVTSSAVVGSSAMSASRPAGECHRDHHPLTPPAGQLVGISTGDTRRSRDAHTAEHRDRLIARRTLVESLVAGERARAIWLPTRIVGFDAERGCWKIIAISCARRVTPPVTGSTSSTTLHTHTSRP